MRASKMPSSTASGLVAASDTSRAVTQGIAFRPAEDLWIKAAKTLSDKDRLPIDFECVNRLNALEDVLAAVEERKRSCLEKRWKYKNSKGEDIILRDLFAKIVVFTLVIDALDECDPDRRHELFEALNTIIQRSASLVKVFVSSRDDGDIVCRLATSLNVFIRTSDNKVDIERFVRTEVGQAIKKKRLIKGDVSGQLEDRIIKALNEGAHGMFRWVSLQIQTLCDWRRIKTEEQISQVLGRLPKTLQESYDIIYQTISDSGPENKMLAEKVMRWLICAKRSLYSHELIAAVSVDSGGRCSNLSNNILLDICCNMVVLDSEQNVFRFAHLSVREYLEGRGEYNLLATHSLALDRCLDVLTMELMLTPTETATKQNSILQAYATFYWPLHCQTVESIQLVDDLRQKLRRFLFQGCDAGPPFTKWVFAAKGSSEFSPRGSIKQMLRTAFSSPTTPLFLACSFSLVSIMDDLGTFQNFDWNQRNDNSDMGLHLAAEKGHEAMVRLLLEAKVDVNIKNRGNVTALHKAVKKGHRAIVLLLLDAKADVNIKNGTLRETALQIAASNGHEAVVRLLLEAKADVDIKSEYGQTALHIAARKGNEAVAGLLLGSKADVDMKDIISQTALHLAARKGNEAMVQLLLEAKADVEIKSRNGWTALHIAAKNGYKAMVRLLLEAKADSTVQGS